uniref:Uncharacterized protein n=1 Tax=Zosterops lateralis melanops TaxID=1220523 RepID=A0A8D2PWF6_ZOSLA
MLSLSLTPLLVLVLGVSLGAAFPQDGLRKGCRLSKYQNIVPEKQKAADRMRQEFVTPLLRVANPGLSHPQMSDRVLLVAAELNITTAMLELPAAPSFAEASRQPLEFFTQAREDVRGCVSASPRALRPCEHGRRAARGWLSPRGRADPARVPPQESTACLRATTIPYVMQVLDNLRCAALQDKC